MAKAFLLFPRQTAEWLGAAVSARFARCPGQPLIRSASNRRKPSWGGLRGRPSSFSLGATHSGILQQGGKPQRWGLESGSRSIPTHAPSGYGVPTTSPTGSPLCLLLLTLPRCFLLPGGELRRGQPAGGCRGCCPQHLPGLGQGPAGGPARLH